MYEKLRAWVNARAFALLLRLCERTEPVAGAASGSGAVVTLQWSTSGVRSVSGKLIYPFVVLSIVRGSTKFYTTLSPAQALRLCVVGEEVVKDQMRTFGHVHPLDWDTTGSKFRFISDDEERAGA